MLPGRGARRFDLSFDGDVRVDFTVANDGADYVRFSAEASRWYWWPLRHFSHRRERSMSRVNDPKGVGHVETTGSL